MENKNSIRRQEIESDLLARFGVMRELQKEVHGLAKKNGFHDEPPHTMTQLGLIVTEVAEAMEESRKPDFAPNKVYFSEGDKPEGLGPELADVVIRALDTAEDHGIDLSREIARKHAFNSTRTHRHGKQF